MLVPYDDPNLLNGSGTATQSPYVIAIRRAGIHTLPSIINAAIFTSAFSAGNSFLFCSSRILYGLSIRGQAPRIFSFCTKNGLPIVSVLFCVGSFLKRGSHCARSSNLACFLVQLLPFVFHERVIRCGQSFQVRIFLFTCQTDSKYVDKYVFIVAGSSTSQLPPDSSRGGPLT